MVFEILYKDFGAEEINISIIRIFWALLIIVFGIFLGRIGKKVLKQGALKAGLDKVMKASFIELLFTVIQWTIYIIFFNFALEALKIPALTSWIVSSLKIVPALVGSLLLIILGFAIATYLKNIIKESKIDGWQILSNTLFYFIFYVFVVFALKMTLLNFDSATVDAIIVVLTTIIAVAIAYWHVSK